MTAPLTVIIPTLNAASQLPATTNALLCGVTDGLIATLVISDGGSTDDIANVARELGATFITGPKGRGGQIARGIAAAKTPWLLILHADTHLSDDWTKPALHHITHHRDKAGWFHLRFRAEGFMPKLVAKGANLRAGLLGLPYGDQGLLIHRDLLEQLGGYPTLPLMEDVALAQNLKGKLVPLMADARTSAARYQKDGWLRRSCKNLVTLARYRLGTPPEALIAAYEGKSPRK
ncbi:TIGR04283 family arsenosugar biosynthesis glycosyltransferase [Rhodobacteraceae bacterium]|nr:TIGR04283 family arsenosugar biosynthesis glycosyltransferase [Paracoccaceae bacterium]